MSCNYVASMFGRYVPFKVRLVLLVVGVFCFVVSLIPQYSQPATPQSIKHARGEPAIPKQQSRRQNQWEDAVNLLIPKVIPLGSLSTTGWWMAHRTWDTKQVKDRRSKANKLVLGTNCAVTHIVETYQYISIKEDLSINYLHFTVSSASRRLRIPSVRVDRRTRKYDPIYEARLYVTLNDGVIQLLKFEFEPGHRSMEGRRANFIVPPGKHVSSVMVILACFGYQGYVAFTDISVSPLAELNKVPSHSDYLSRCPPVKNGSLASLPVKSFFSEDVWSVFSVKDRNAITLVTQLTLNRLSKLKMALKVWNGPISVVIYVVVDDKDELDEAKADVEEKLNRELFRKFSSAHVTVLYGDQGGVRYPINYLRNMAIRNVKTKYMLMIDADFVPSKGLDTRARLQIKNFIENNGEVERVGFVVPAFEYLRKTKLRLLPKTRQRLKKLIQQDLIIPFRQIDSPLSHKPTNYERWYNSSTPYETSDYQDKYEPYLILRATPSLPLFDERFIGYGMNKISHIMELAVLGYKFVVLPNVWIVHCHHQQSKLSIEHLMNPNIRFMNRLKRFQFLSQLNSKHGLGMCPKENTVQQ